MNDLLAGLNGGNVPALDLIFMITLVALLPSIAVMMTSFTRTIIILSFTRNAMGIQQTPPNTVLVGISLFLTLYIMSPVIGRVNAEAYEPYTRGEITQMEAVQRMGVPIKEFMLRNTEKETLDHFVEMSGTQTHCQEFPLGILSQEVFMSNLQVLDIMYQAFQLALRLSMPFLLVSMAVGVLIAIFQAATQINEQTMTFVPKLLAILAMMGILGSSMLVMLQDFTRQVCAMIAGG